MTPLHVIILAAGQGTRMKSALPKVLHPVGGRAMLGHVLDTARALGAARCHVVLGHGADQVREWFAASGADAAGVAWTSQEKQLGTAHAVLQAIPEVPDAARILVLYGDVPLITVAALQALLAAAPAGLAVLTTRLAQPQGYGRMLRNASGAICGIVEEKDASPAQRAITEVNTGVMALPAKLAKRWLPKVQNQNAKGEYYLTDLVAMAALERIDIAAVDAAPEEVEGVNDREQLARLERVFQRRQASQLMRDGVYLADPARFDLRGVLKAGRDVKIDVGVVVEGHVELGDNVSIGPYCVIRDARLAAGTEVAAHSVLDGCEVGEGARIGPFARIRPESKLGRAAHVGNFVEIKKSTLGDGAKANHLAYIGDATIGARVNVGAGTITCNYDGANKHPTVIGDDVFIGSDTQLVAPVTIGAGATIGAGSTITRDVPPGGMTLCRAREQKSFPGWKRPEKKK